MFKRDRLRGGPEKLYFIYVCLLNDSAFLFSIIILFLKAGIPRPVFQSPVHSVQLFQTSSQINQSMNYSVGSRRFLLLCMNIFLTECIASPSVFLPAAAGPKGGIMNFKQFQKTLAAAVRDQSENTLEIRLQTVTKNNGIRRRAMEISGGQKGIYPSIYMEPYYHRYQNGVPVNQLADLVLEQCGHYGSRFTLPENFFADYEEVRDRIYCKLINYRQNKEMLTRVPHLRWLDLALVCYYIVKPDILQDASILIKEEHLRSWKISEEKLIQNAWDITVENMKPVFRPLSSVLSEMNVDFVPEEETDGEGTDTGLFILTNEIKTFGAVLIADPDRQREIAKIMKGNYYMLPSSVHECLILPGEDAGDEKMLIAMIREINRTQVAPQEVLSDNLYFYDARRETMCVLEG